MSQYDTREESRGELPIASRMNEVGGPKQIGCTVVDVSGDESKI